MAGQILLVVAASFAAGGALIFFASLSPRLKAKAPELWSFYFSEFLIVGAYLIPAALGNWALAAALVAFCWRGQIELFRLFGVEEGGAAYAAMAAAAALIVIAASGLVPALMELASGRAGVMSGPVVLGLLPVLIVLAGGTAAVPVLAFFEKPETRMRTLMTAAASLIFPALMVALIAALRAQNKGFLWLVFIYATVEMNDAFALVFGKLFGRTPVLPKISPRKTLEGLIGGLVVGAITGVSFSYYVMEFSFASALQVSAVVLVVGIAGDLITSALKRSQGKKDFAPVLAHHGGVLDIYDSVLFAAPVIYIWQFALP